MMQAIGLQVYNYHYQVKSTITQALYLQLKLTVRLTLAIEGPWVRSVLTMSDFPAQAAKWRGLEPLSSALLQEAS
jgi:hypothetical protein